MWQDFLCTLFYMLQNISSDSKKKKLRPISACPAMHVTMLVAITANRSYQGWSRQRQLENLARGVSGAFPIGTQGFPKGGKPHVPRPSVPREREVSMRQLDSEQRRVVSSRRLDQSDQRAQHSVCKRDPGIFENGSCAQVKRKLALPTLKLEDETWTTTRAAEPEILKAHQDEPLMQQRQVDTSTAEHAVLDAA
jgi:hypothetical protein